MSKKIATDEEMKEEALRRLDFWVKNFDLNTNVWSYFKNDRLYYSYLTAGGYMGSVDTISYDAEYEKKVRRFEKYFDVLVYHCIETPTQYGTFLSMLFVGRNKDDWKIEWPMSDGVVMANVYNIDFDFEEVGDVKLASFQNVLVRIE